VDRLRRQAHVRPTIEAQLDSAITEQRYEHAAACRDELKRRREPVKEMTDQDYKNLIKALYPADNSRRFRRNL
jgi:UvrB/uvrC motif